MSFTPANPSLVGRYVKLSRPMSSCSGTFSPGHVLKVIGRGDRGYDLEDVHGNQITETGFPDFIPATEDEYRNQD